MFLLTSEEKIHFENKPFMARIAGNGNKPIKCTPVVYEEPSKCGVGLFFENGFGVVWGPGNPRNLIAAWRGTEVLRLFDTIGNCTLAEAYYTGMRNPREINMESVRLTIKKIGQAEYDRIMNTPIPSAIIKAILENQGRYGKYGANLSLDVWPIIEEMRAGTILWQRKFADAGIKHLDEIESEERARKQIVAKFEELLISYSRSRKIPLTCKSMEHVEDALLTLVDKRAQKLQSDRMLVSLAGVVGHLAHLKSVSFPLSLLDGEERNKRLDKMKEIAVDHSAAWFVSNSVQYLFFWKQSGTKKLLRRLLREYFPTEADVLLHGAK